MLAALKKMLGGFRRNEDGGVTVELVMWIPAAAAAINFVTDTTLVMMTQQQMRDAARDASRMVALGQRSPEEAQAFMLSQLDNSGSFSANVYIDNNIVTASLAKAAENVTGSSVIYSGKTISSEVSMWIENHEGT